MDYNYQDLGHQQRGTTVRVTLTGNEANVRLLDRSNYLLFEQGRSCRGVGGGFDRSPIYLQVPHNDHWYLIIDYGGFAGHGSATVQVFPVAS
jgi:hypothetical protein